MTNYVLLKTIAAFVTVPLWLPSTRRRVEALLFDAGFTRSIALVTASRLIPLVVAFPLLHLKFPQDAAEWAWLLEQPPGTSPYSPGFDALLAGLWHLGHSPLAFIIAMAAAETAAFAVFWSASAPHGTTVTRSLLAFWAVNPLSLFHIAVGGQDEALILLAWCGVVWAVLRGRPLVGGLLGAGGVLMSKVLAGLACLPLLALPASAMITGLAAVAATTLVSVVALLSVHVPVLGFLNELGYPTSGHLWEFLELLRLAPRDRPVLLAVGLAAGVMAASVIYVRRNPIKDVLSQILRLTGTVGCLFRLMSPKSPTAWMVIFLPGILFLTLTLERVAQRFVTVLFFPVSIFEPSLWFYFEKGRGFEHSMSLRLGMLLVDSILLVGYGLLIRQGLRLGRVTERDMRDRNLETGSSLR